MTKLEYKTAYRKARTTTAKLTREAMTELKRTYITAGQNVAKAIREADVTGADELMVSGWRSIERQLAAAASDISAKLGEVVPKGIGDSAVLASSLDEKWLLDAAKEAGVLDAKAIRAVFAGVNTKVIESVVSRVWEDGYSFSTRIWKVGDEFQNDIKRIMTAGFAQGRDPVKIAGDVQGFISGGKVQLMKRYGKLKAGTAAFVRRIPVNVDYRAMRLIRTELYSSLKEAARQSGMANPGCTQEFDWVMEAGRAHWDCTCPDLAAGSPYKADEVPVQPHPNCMCILMPRLKDRREFVADLTKWANGEQVDYLDTWKRDYYDKV